MTTTRMTAARGTAARRTAARTALGRRVGRGGATALPGGRRRADRRAVLLVTLGVVVVAFAARLVPVLRGGGLRGLGNYDDGVYFSGALALTHGRLPYSDFLFLHPPGVLLLLAPFAALSRVSSDPTAMALARLGFMGLGALSAALVVRVLLPLGLFAAAAGGLFYAFFYPAVYAEHSTLLEGAASFLLLVALVLLRETGRPLLPRSQVLAGVALGLSTTVKIWGVAAVAVVAAMQALQEGRRAGLRVLAGAALAAAVVCLPFFLAAPGDMARLVVQDQLGRPHPASSLTDRLGNLLGLSVRISLSHRLLPLLAVVGALAVGAMLLAWQVRSARTAVVLLIVLSGVLLSGPTWFLHYSGLIAPPAAVVLGAAVARLAALVPSSAPPLGRRVAAGALFVALVLYGVPGVLHGLGHPFPYRSMSAAARSVQGCVTADEPTALVLMNVLSRDLDRACRVVVDVTGVTYDAADARTATGAAVPRDRNARWQQFLRGYLLSGRATMMARPDGDRPSQATQAALDRLPVLHRSGQYVLRGR